MWVEPRPSHRGSGALRSHQLRQLTRPTPPGHLSVTLEGRLAADTPPCGTGAPFDCFDSLRRWQGNFYNVGTDRLPPAVAGQLLQCGNGRANNLLIIIERDYLQNMLKWMARILTCDLPPSVVDPMLYIEVFIFHRSWIFTRYVTQERKCIGI